MLETASFLLRWEQGDSHLKVFFRLKKKMLISKNLKFLKRM